MFTWRSSAWNGQLFSEEKTGAESVEGIEKRVMETVERCLMTRKKLKWLKGVGSISNLWSAYYNSGEQNVSWDRVRYFVCTHLNLQEVLRDGILTSCFFTQRTAESKFGNCTQKQKRRDKEENRHRSSWSALMQKEECGISFSWTKNGMRTQNAGKLPLQNVLSHFHITVPFEDSFFGFRFNTINETCEKIPWTMLINWGVDSKALLFPFFWKKLGFVSNWVHSSLVRSSFFENSLHDKE